MQPQQSIVKTISERYLREIEYMNEFDGVEQLFKKESKLLLEIHHLEANNAKKTLQEIIDIFSARFGKQMLKVVRYYFLVLSSIVTRKLIENQVPPTKAFAFNIACTEMIELEMKDAEFMQFADALIDFYIGFIANRKQPTFSHQTVNKVIIFINDGLETNLTVDLIAKQYNVSTSHLSRIFREHVGLTIVEYLNGRRVEEAQYYLRNTTKSITAISQQFHFCNQSYFTRIFKKYTGVTPKQFRDERHHEFFSLNMSIEDQPTVAQYKALTL